MKKHDLATSIGLFFGISVVVFGILQGGSLRNFWDPGSVLITIFGSFAATVINSPPEECKRIFKVMMQSFTDLKFSKIEVINQFGELSRKARREGLLSLEDEVGSIQEPFLKKGLQMVIDGVEPENIREILELEIDEMDARHRVGADMIKAWGGYAPGFGMIGTLVGLINMLVYLDDSSKIASGMAVALITTFYGSILANLLFNPMSAKLGLKNDKEVSMRELLLEGILSIQSGVNPRIVEEKLICYLSPQERKQFSASSAQGQEVSANG